MANQTAHALQLLQDALQLLQDQTGTFHVMSDSYQMRLFGKVGVFPNRLIEGNWVQLRADRWSPPAFWHGLTLSQLHTLLSDGVWKFGFWKRKTKTSPLALWVATSRSAAMDRASPKRGYAAQQSTLPSEWDCPVAIGLNVAAELFGNGGHKPLKNGVERKRMLAGGRREMPVEELNIVEVDFFAPAFERYRILSALWPSLKSRERVLCRCEVGNPGICFSRVVMVHHGLAAGRCPGTTATDTVGKRQMLEVSGVAPLVIATKNYSLGV